MGVFFEVVGVLALTALGFGVVMAILAKTDKDMSDYYPPEELNEDEEI